MIIKSSDRNWSLRSGKVTPIWKPIEKAHFSGFLLLFEEGEFPSSRSRPSTLCILSCLLSRLPFQLRSSLFSFLALWTSSFKPLPWTQRPDSMKKIAPCLSFFALHPSTHFSWHLFQFLVLRETFTFMHSVNSHSLQQLICFLQYYMFIISQAYFINLNILELCLRASIYLLSVFLPFLSLYLIFSFQVHFKYQTFSLCHMLSIYIWRLNTEVTSPCYLLYEFVKFSVKSFDYTRSLILEWIHYMHKQNSQK